MKTSNRREMAEQLIRAGHTVNQVAQQLHLSSNTLRSWIRRYHWDSTDAVGNVHHAISTKLHQLLAIDHPTEADLQNIERYLGYLERVENLKHKVQTKASDAIGPVPEESPPTPDKPKTEKRQKGRPKASEKNVIDADMTADLLDEFERSIFDYQREWWQVRFKDGRIILKSRQIGATYYFAMEALLIAIMTGRNQIFVSASKKQAAQFRRNIIRFVNKVCGLDLQGDPMRIKLPDHEAGEVYLYFLGTQVSSVQGYSGDLYLDECAWVRKFEDIQEVASAMALQAVYRETYFTTPSSTDHDFYKFWTGAAYNKDRDKAEHITLDTSHENLKEGKDCADGYWRQIVTIEDAIRKGCTLFNLEKVKRKYSPARYAMLCLCQFTSAIKSLFKFNQLYSSLVEALEKWKGFDPLAPRPLGDMPCWLGYDPSGLGDDAAALVVVAPPNTDYAKYRVIEVIRMDDADYQEQFEQVEALLKKYNITYIGIDNQGEGSGVYQKVQAAYPQAEAIRYNPEVKSDLVTKAQVLFRRGLIEIDNIYMDEVLPALLAIQRDSTRDGLPTYTAKRSADVGHADVAWALMHALHHADFESLIDTQAEGTGASMMEFF